MSWQLGPPGALIVLFLTATGLGMKYTHKLFYGEFQSMEKSPYAMFMKKAKFIPDYETEKSD